jgi:capsular polysaccharide export protein
LSLRPSALPASPTGQSGRQPLYVYSGGFLTEAGVRRILTLAGYDLRLGLPGQGDTVAVWGHSPTAARGEAVSALRDARIVRIEDAFLRSIHPGRAETPAGLLIDPVGVHYDPSGPSRIEQILAGEPLDDTAILQRAHWGMARWNRLKLSKYNNFSESAHLPAPGYVLIIDQKPGDAAIRHGGAGAATFREMLNAAVDDFPHARIVIKLHPAAEGRHHFREMDFGPRVTFLDAPISPAALLEGASAVYTVSSQMGFEAILAGHRPRVFGRPFYAGWGLSEDNQPIPRRGRKLSRAQLFAAAMILAPTWYDPCRDRLCSYEDAVDLMEARLRVWREDSAGHVAVGMKRWKRRVLCDFFGQSRPLKFAATPGRAIALSRETGRGLLVWGSVDPAPEGLPLRRVEDGFLRSRGLGARLVPPLSLIADDLGMHYDPARESRLERLIAAPCPPDSLQRAERLVGRLIAAGLSKYNTGSEMTEPLRPGHRILVPGQVENDASVLLGCGSVRTNLALLEACRAANPDAVLVYKPHPDVEAGLRPGRLTESQVMAHADHLALEADPATLIAQVDEVWTLTSLLGFEALLRGKKVTCLGQPFYAGWGLTHDLMPPIARRSARPTLAQLVHAALIGYPRYLDPVSGLPCPVEVVIERLAQGNVPPQRPMLRLLSLLQLARRRRH